MSDDSTIIALSIGAELNTRSFEEAMKKFQEWKGKFSSSLDKGFFETGPARSIQKQLEKYLNIDPDKLVSPQAIGNITRKVNDLNKIILQVNFDAKRSLSDKYSEEFDKAASVFESKSEEFQAKVKRIISRHAETAGKGGLLGQAFNSFFGGDHTNEGITKHIGTLDKLMAAEKEYEKWMYAHDKMSRIFGSSWGDDRNFEYMQAAINSRKIAFDKDTGFTSNNYKYGSAVLGITEEELISLNKNRERYSPAYDKIKKLQENGYFSQIGSGASTSTLITAEMSGNITANSKALKINNEEGLRAVGISEQQAIRLGILSRSYGGNAIELQKLEAKFKELSVSEQNAFNALNIDKNNIYQFKAALDSIRDAGERAMKEGITDPLKIADMTLESFKKKTSPAELASRFEKLYASSRPQTQDAMMSAKGASGGDVGRLNAFLDVIEKTDKAVSRLANGMQSTTGKEKFLDTVNIWKMVLAEANGTLEITSKNISTVKTKMTELEKVRNAFSGRSDSFKTGLESLLKEFGNNTNDATFKTKLQMLVSADNTIIKFTEHLKSMGASDEYLKRMLGGIDATTLAFNRTSKEAQNFLSNNDRVSKSFTNITHPSTMLSRALTDLYDKFKILAGYAVSGSIAYGLGNMFKDGISNIVKYDQALHDLRAITESSENQTRQMGDTVLQVAMNSKYTILEVTEAMKTLGQAGLTSSEVIASIVPISKLAMATASNLGQVSDLVTSIMASFEIPYSETSKVVDVLGAAINRSKLDVEKLRTAFNYIGPVAHDAGISLEETAASLSIMSNAGIKASTMATALRQVMDKILNPTKEMSEALALAGYTVDDIDPKFHSLAEIIGKLGIVAPTTASALKIFDQRAASAFLALSASGQDGIEQMTKNMQQIGTVSVMYREQMEGLEAKAQKAKNAIAVFGILGGETFKIGTIIDKVVSSVGAFFSSINNATGGFADFLKNLVLTSTALSLFGIVIAAVTTNWKLMTAAAQDSIMSNIAAANTINLLSTSFTVLGVSIKGIGLLGLVSTFIAVGTAAYTYFTQMEDGLEKQRKSTENLQKEQEIENEIAKTNIATSEKYISVLRDTSASLEDRKFAVMSLSDMGAKLDTSIFNNINSVEDFNTALENSKPIIESYREQLRGLAGEKAGALLSAHVAIAENAKDREKDSLKKMNESRTDKIKMPIPIVDDATGMVNQVDVLVSSGDPKAYSEASKQYTESQATIAEQKKYVKTVVDNYLATNKEVKEYLENALRSDDPSAVINARKTVISEITANMSGVSDDAMKYLQEATQETIDSYKTVGGMNRLYAAKVEKIKYQSGLDNKAGSIDKAMEIIQQAGDVYQKNIQTIDAQWEKRKNDINFSSLSKKDQDTAEASYTASKNAAKEEHTKVVSKIWKDVQTAQENLLEIDRSIASTQINDMRASGKYSDQKAAEEEENIRLVHAQKRLETIEKILAVTNRGNALNDETRTQLEKDRHKILEEISKAKADKVKKVNAANKRDDRSNTADMNEQLKEQKREFDFATSSLEAEEANRIEAAKIKFVSNARDEESAIFDIKAEYFQKRLVLAQQYAKEEEEIISSHGGDMELAKMRTTIKNLEKELANLRGNRANKIQQEQEHDRLEKINLDYEDRSILIESIKNENERAAQAEILSYDKARQANEEKLKKGEYDKENYDKAMENLEKSHQNRMKDISGTWSNGIQRGFDTFTNSVGTWAQQVEGITTKTLGYLSDQLTELVLTGKANFKDMINSMLKDMARAANNKLVQALIGGADRDPSKPGETPTAGGIFGGLLGLLNTKTETPKTNKKDDNAPKEEVGATAINNIETKSADLFGGLWKDISGLFTQMKGGLVDMFSSLGDVLSGLFSSGSSGDGGIFGFISSLFTSKMADGGAVPGYSSSPTADNIPIWATAGEFIQPVPVVEYYGRGLMEALRTRSIPREVFSRYSNSSAFHPGSNHYATGGSVVDHRKGGQEEPKYNSITVPITINNGDANSVKSAIPELITAVKKAIGDDVRNNGEMRKIIMNYAR